MLTLLRRLLSVGTDAAPEENFFISSGLEFYGDLVARASSGRIEGKFDGHIIECRKLIIGPHATIKGNVFAEEIVVYGYCEGNLYAAGDMKVFDTAVILGDIHASSLIVEHNATFRGNLRKLRTEDFLEITAREKEKIIQQRKSNVYNIHSLNARLEAEQRRARKVANGMPLTPETEELPASPLKRIQNASPIVVPQNRITPSPVTTGSELPRAINIPASPVDVSTLSGGSSDFMVPAMDESFLPDYVVPLPAIGHEALVEKQQENVREEATANTSAEPSASMLLLETEIPAPVEATEVAVEETAYTSEQVVSIETESIEAEIMIGADATSDEEFIGDAPVEMVETVTSEFTLETLTDALVEVDTPMEPIEVEAPADFFMDTEDAEALIDAQLQADAQWLASEDEPALQTLEEVSSINELSSVEAFEVDIEEIRLTEETDEWVMGEEEISSDVESGSSFSIPDMVTPSFDIFPVDASDNGIRIDPSIPFIRIPDASPRVEETHTEESQMEIRASFMDTFAGELSDLGTDVHLEAQLPETPAEILRVRSTQAKTMIPRQLTSPEAFELREASGTMIIIREEEADLTDEDAAIDRRQQGGPELRGSESMEQEEPKFKMSAVPTAEPGYEPGYTNQQRTTRKPVTVQPENTRRWF
jgi:cytoskeletal protein CcmA (bactofilin family)